MPWLEPSFSYLIALPKAIKDKKSQIIINKVSLNMTWGQHLFFCFPFLALKFKFPLIPVSVPEGQVIGRGCSTRDKVFYKECQTHSYGDSVEKMCFCSFFLCNGSGSKPPLTPSTWLIALAASLLIWRYLESNSQWQLKGELYINS